MTDYQKQANDFLKSTNTKFKCEFLRFGKYFDDDKKERDIYTITLSRGNRSYTFAFGQSIVHSGLKVNGKIIDLPNIKREDLTLRNLTLKYYLQQKIGYPLISKDKIEYPEQPTAYDVLACLTKYDPGDFENFCVDHGYDTDSRKAEKIYNAVCNEFKNIQALYNDVEIDLLSEIQ
jgi:hypothetical protein